MGGGWSAFGRGGVRVKDAMYQNYDDQISNAWRR
jgi:hypothetical protein